MSILIFGNNNQTTLAAPINNSVTTLSVFPGGGTAFPHPATNQYFVATITDAATGDINEILWVTNVTSDTFTIVRARENTTAKSWLAGDFVSCFPTAFTQATFVQPDQLQQGLYAYVIGAGTANAITGTVVSNLTTLPDGMTVVVKSGATNTGPTTFRLTLGSTVLAVLPVVKGNNQALIAGDIAAAGYPIQLNWSTTFNAWVLQNPATGVSTIPTGSVFTFACVAASLPAGFILTNGALVSRVTYAALWTFAQASGNIVSDATWSAGLYYGAFSNGDGSTTFRLPQLGGYFVRPLDNGNGVDPGRLIGTTQGGQNVTHTHTATSGTNSVVTDPGHRHTSQSSPGIGQGANGANTVQQSSGSHLTESAGTGISVTSTTTTSIINSGGSEARPINIAYVYAIKY